MIVLDTHALLWWVSRPAALGSKGRRAVDAADRLGVSAISFWEIATLVRKGRLELDRPLAEWIGGALALPRLEELPVTSGIAARAGAFGDDFQGDPADRLIAATALSLNAPLVTKDERLRHSPLLQTLW